LIVKSFITLFFDGMPMKPSKKRLRRKYQWTLTGGVLTLLLTGCSSPMERTIEQQLRDQLAASQRQYIQESAKASTVRVSRAPSEVENELSDERRAELDKISGPTAYQNAPFVLGSSLTGQTQEETATVAMTLQQAIHLAVKNNLTVQVDRLQPAIAQTQVTQAEAVFDAVLFMNYDFQRLDTPTPVRIGAISNLRSSHVHSQTMTGGVRKNLSTGGQVSVQTGFSRNYIDPSTYVANSYYTANLMASITQPLLRNFGSDVTLAEIELASNNRDRSIETLRITLLDTALETERAFWNLVLARQQLLIQTRLLERTIADRDQIKARVNYDASPVRITEANSFVELRRADVIRARQAVRVASDTLKRLINDPELSVASETLIVPADAPIEEAVEFSLADAIRTALDNRPEIKQALLLIEDSRIRQRVAENLRLPRLDATAAVRLNGRADGVIEAYSALEDRDYIDYLFGFQFEHPLGNREANALYRQRQLERQASVLNYRRAAQDVVVEIKDALRQIESAYELIGATRAARRAASDNLRALERQEEVGVALTPEFLLDLKLSTQQRLADAEIQEMQALTGYNTAIASYYRTIGTLLERNRIEFKPEVE